MQQATAFRVHMLSLAPFFKGEKIMLNKAALLPSPAECSMVRSWLLVRDLTTHELKLAHPGFGQTWLREKIPHLIISHQSSLPHSVNLCQSMASQVSEISLLLCCHPAASGVPGTYSIPILGYRRDGFIGCLQRQCWYQPLGA